MSQISLNQFRIYLSYLLVERAGELEASRAAALFTPKLRAAHEAFAAHRKPDEDHGATTEALVTTARRQDEQRQVVARAADLIEIAVPEGADVASSLRAVVSTDRIRSYVDRAAEADAIADEVAGLEPVIRGLPGALGEVVGPALAAFVQAGRDLRPLLTMRANAVSHGASGASIASRLGQTTALLGQFRAAVRVEVDLDPALPRDLEARLFGYHDAMVAEARSRQTARRSARVQRPIEAPLATATAVVKAG